MDSIETRMGRVESALDDIRNLLMNSRAFHENQGYADDEADPPPELIDNRLTKIQSVKIEDILVNFDFEKVHRVMELLGWTWASSPNPGVPSVETLKNEAKRLLIDACVMHTNIATGGFRAVYDNRDENGEIDESDPYIGLEFIIEETEGFDEDQNTTCKIDTI